MCELLLVTEVQMELTERVRPVRWGILLALTTLVYGFGLGGTFGAAEDSIKNHLKTSAESVLDSAYKGDRVKLTRITSMSWVFFKRAHLHANGLGTTALALCLLLAFGMPRGSEQLKTAASVCIGAGALGYAMFWMFAGLKAPGLASTGAAKESLEWWAIPSSALCFTVWP